MKVIIRIIASPFVYGVQFVWLNYVCFKNTFLFIRYGGEWITYDTDRTKPTISRVYDELKKQNESINQASQTK